MYVHFGVSADICGVRGLFIRFSISRTFVYVKIFIGLKIDLSKLHKCFHTNCNGKKNSFSKSL